MENFHELIEEAREAVSITEDVRREYYSAATHRDKALLKALNSVSSTKEALLVYKLSGNRILKWLALDKAIQMLGTELSDLEDYNALPQVIGQNVSWGKNNWLFSELIRNGTISTQNLDAWSGGSAWLCEFAYSLKQEKRRKLDLVGEKITSFEHLLEYWNLLPKEIRYDVRDKKLEAIATVEELESVRKKFKKSRIWPNYHFFYYERCLRRLKNAS